MRFFNFKKDTIKMRLYKFDKKDHPPNLRVTDSAKYTETFKHKKVFCISKVSK